MVTEFSNLTIQTLTSKKSKMAKRNNYSNEYVLKRFYIYGKCNHILEKRNQTVKQRYSHLPTMNKTKFKRMEDNYLRYGKVKDALEAVFAFFIHNFFFLSFIRYRYSYKSQSLVFLRLNSVFKVPQFSSLEFVAFEIFYTWCSDHVLILKFATYQEVEEHVSTKIAVFGSLRADLQILKL